jgi:hypothetical protein
MARATAEETNTADDATLEALLLGAAEEFRARVAEKQLAAAANNLVAVKALHARAWDPQFVEFEFCANGVASDSLRFAGRFVDRTDYRVLCTTPASELLAYPRGKALVSLLHNQRFGGVEEFAVACLNALGADVDTCALEGKIEYIVSVG